MAQSVHLLIHPPTPAYHKLIRYLDKPSFDAVTKNVLGFLVGMSAFSVTGAPIFSEDDHHVTLPVRNVDRNQRKVKVCNPRKVRVSAVITEPPLWTWTRHRLFSNV